MGKWGKFRALSIRDRLNLLLFSALLPLVDAGLRGMGYRRFRGFLAAHPRQLAKYRGTEIEAIEVSKHISYLVSVASGYGLFHFSCLRRSLLIWWLLRRKGIQTDLRIGVKKQEGQLYAHAWIKLGNEIINDSVEVERTFSAFNDLPVE
jgi:hypothetical protein